MPLIHPAGFWIALACPDTTCVNMGEPKVLGPAQDGGNDAAQMSALEPRRSPVISHKLRGGVPELIGQLPLANAVLDSQDREQMTEPIRRDTTRHASRSRIFPKETAERRAIPLALTAIQEDVVIGVCSVLPNALAMKIPQKAERARIKADHPHVARRLGRLVVLQPNHAGLPIDIGPAHLPHLTRSAARAATEEQGPRAGPLRPTAMVEARPTASTL